MIFPNTQKQNYAIYKTNECIQQYTREKEKLIYYSIIQFCIDPTNEMSCENILQHCMLHWEAMGSHYNVPLYIYN